MKKRERKPELDNRLEAYATTLRQSSSGELLRRSAEKWPVYAAVTGAALAMASNASASIIYSGIINATAAASAPGLYRTASAFTTVHLKNGSGGLLSRTFLLANLRQQGYSGQLGVAIGGGASGVGFLLHSSTVKRLSSGAVISGAGNTATSEFANGFVSGPGGIAARGNFRTTYGYVGTFDRGWSQTKGFAAFSFNPGSGADYGWVRLQFTVGQDGTLDSITAIDWAYQDDGSAILAGDTGISATPEPSTAALTLLAVGAAGVEALRRRRKAAA
jgi:hypothetical protein